MSETARIVLLSGPGSAGKSAIAKALQAITAEPFLHVEMDAFMTMLPDSYFGDPAGMVFETILEDGKPSIVIHTGPMVENALRGMRHAVAAMAAQGNNQIVDDVMLGNENAEYTALLAPYRLYRVGVFAPLEVLEARERQRGDREIGLARWQHERVHRNIDYDLKLDTTRATPLECAERIRRTFGL
ncbi:MAG: chloramphenicol phosphotransferase [Rhodospirillaceae bacterium]|nr:chloramphenicol phosphotransferase [Rhodospirillaceae bacterium]